MPGAGPLYLPACTVSFKNKTCSFLRSLCNHFCLFLMFVSKRFREEQHPHVVKRLLQDPRLDINKPSISLFGQTHYPIHKAITSKHPDIMQMLFERPEIDLSVCDNHGRSALIRIAEKYLEWQQSDSQKDHIGLFFGRVKRKRRQTRQDARSFSVVAGIGKSGTILPTNKPSFDVPEVIVIKFLSFLEPIAKCEICGQNIFHPYIYRDQILFLPNNKFYHVLCIFQNAPVTE